MSGVIQNRTKAKQKQEGLTLWGCFYLSLALVCASALGVVYSTHSSRHLLNELQTLENQRNALQVEWGQLLLEQSSLMSQGQVEELARAELNMIIPGREDIVVVRR
ncbi:MAG: cell division protein FtsL [Gammaproteobacteria bacterium]|nr:cell division protein FtsL [Gammaproteobacteria bacterium]